MGGLGSGSRVTESSRHHQVTTEVSFDTTSDFNLSFFDSSTPPTPPTAATAGASSSSSSTSGVVLKEEYDDASPPSQDGGGGSGGVFDNLGSDGCMFNSPPPTTPPSPSSSAIESTPENAVKIKSEFDVVNSFSSPHRGPQTSRPAINLFPAPKSGSNPPPTPPSTPITLKSGESKISCPVI